MQQPLSSLPHIRFSVDKFYDRNSRNTQEKGRPLGGGQTGNSGKALLGPLLQQEGMRTSNTFPWLLAP